jgi:hypothetical protein
MKLGEILMSSGAVTAEELDQALTRARRVQQRLGSAFIALGIADVDQIAEALSQQLRVPPARDRHLRQVPHDIIALVPQEMARRLCAIPVGGTKDGELVIAMRDPGDAQAVAELEQVTDYRVVPAVASEVRLRQAIEGLYARSSAAKRSRGAATGTPALAPIAGDRDANPPKLARRSETPSQPPPSAPAPAHEPRGTAPGIGAARARNPAPSGGISTMSAGHLPEGDSSVLFDLPDTIVASAGPEGPDAIGLPSGEFIDLPPIRPPSPSRVRSPSSQLPPTTEAEAARARRVSAFTTPRSAAPSSPPPSIEMPSLEAEIPLDLSGISMTPALDGDGQRDDEVASTGSPQLEPEPSPIALDIEFSGGIEVPQMTLAAAPSSGIARLELPEELERGRPDGPLVGDLELDVTADAAVEATADAAAASASAAPATTPSSPPVPAPSPLPRRPVTQVPRGPARWEPGPVFKSAAILLGLGLSLFVGWWVIGKSFFAEEPKPVAGVVRAKGMGIKMTFPADARWGRVGISNASILGQTAKLARFARKIEEEEVWMMRLPSPAQFPAGVDLHHFRATFGEVESSMRTFRHHGYQIDDIRCKVSELRAEIGAMCEGTAVNSGRAYRLRLFFWLATGEDILAILYVAAAERFDEEFIRGAVSSIEFDL